jgi:hypothetical protein
MVKLIDTESSSRRKSTGERFMITNQKGMYFLAHLRRAIVDDLLANPPTALGWCRHLMSLKPASLLTSGCWPVRVSQ